MASQQRAQGAGAAVAYEFADGAGTRAKYREEQNARPANIMYDKRVVRGSTYSLPIQTPAAISAATSKKKDEEFKANRAAEATRRVELAASRVHTPPPVAGRKHADANTENFIEVLSDRAPEEEAGVQTDAHLDRPPTPIFVPKPSGTDVATQIEAGELFDFDFEVSPLLDVLVGKTLEQALAEVVQEDELAAIRSKQAEYEAVRGAELAEVQRLEAEVKRRFAEKQRRVEQENARVKREAEVREKVAAGAFARTYLASLRRGVFSQLHESGHFYDPVRREMESQVLPGVFAALASRLATRQTAAVKLTDDLIAQALQLGETKYADRLASDDAAAAAAKAAQEAEAAAKIAEAAAKAAADAATASINPEGGEEAAQ